MVEYYVVENFGNYDPSSQATNKGSFTVDGSNYKIAQSTRVNQPSIEGTKTFEQYWSVRSSKRTSGTVNVKAHFDQWASKGMKLGKHNYQVVGMYNVYAKVFLNGVLTNGLAVEGYHSSGSARITVNQK